MLWTLISPCSNYKLHKRTAGGNLLDFLFFLQTWDFRRPSPLNTKLTWMGIQCNRLALLNSILYCANSDSKTSDFAGLWGFYYCFTDLSLTMLAYGKKSPVHHMIIQYILYAQLIIQLGHNKNWLQGLLHFVGAWSRRWGQLSVAEEIVAKPTALNSPPPLFHWFYQRTKNHPSMFSIGVYITSCYSLTCVLSWVRTGHAVPNIENQYVAANVDFFFLPYRHK